jgi:membrane-associated phospholipid phosphatase
MFFRAIGVFALIIGVAQTGYGQDETTQTSCPAQRPLGSAGAESADDRSVGWAAIVPNILDDQKQIYWKFPGQVARGKHWVPAVGVLAATAALIATDQFSAPHFRNSSTYHGFNYVFSGTNTSLGILFAPLSMYGVGLLTHNSYAEKTALLTGEAVADSEILDEVLKLSTRRARPESISQRGNFADTWLDSHTITDGGFASGHTIAAFSVATVIADRYGPRHRWVPYVAYGLAATVGFSRVSLSAHFPSDVFVGAALGYTISHFAVLHSSRHFSDK